MKLRETLNQNKAAALAAGVILIGLAALMLFWPSDQRGVYYTTDDGQTWFEHEPTMPPFSHRGAEAVRAMLFSCDGGKTKFVGYMMKYKDEESRLAAERAIAARTIPPTAGQVVKRPGDTEWVPLGSSMVLGPPGAKGNGNGQGGGGGGMTGQQITQVACPDGGVPIMINPGFVEP